MSLRICFYELLGLEKKECSLIYSIRAGEVCSEFIARYFYKTERLEECLINKIKREHYPEENNINEKEQIARDIYTVNIEKMEKDTKEKFEIKTFKESETVRENLLKKYKEVYKNNFQEERIGIYAIIAVA